MKKLLLLFLLIAGGVSTASADEELYLHNYNSSWGAYPAFTNEGVNGSGETVWTYTLNSSTGLNSDDFYFRLKYNVFNDDLRPYDSDYAFNLDSKTNETYTIKHSDGSHVFGASSAFRIKHATYKASEYKITVYAKKNDVYYVKVDVISMPVTIGSTGKATFFCDRALDFTDTGISAYTIINSNKATGVLTTSDALTEVPANTGLYLEGTAKTYDVPVLASASSVGDNMLVGVTEDTKIYQIDGAYTNYILTVNKQGGDVATPKFFKVYDDGDENANEEEDDGNTVLAGKAYLQIRTEDAARESFWFDAETTAIEKLTPTISEGVVYDLQGRKVMNPAKGLYIVNGKKVIK